jgi:hypothetical protein
VSGFLAASVERRLISGWYGRLVADGKWAPTTPFEEALGRWANLDWLPGS